MITVWLRFSSHMLSTQFQITTQPTSDMHNLLTANELRQLSHIEILLECERPETRLCRLLGHISVYDSATHADEILALEAARREAALLLLPSTRPACRMSTVDSPLQPPSLAQSQAAIRVHSAKDKQTTVHEEELDVDSVDTLLDESDEETSWSEEDYLTMDVIKMGTVTILQRDVWDEVTGNRRNETALKSIEKR